ncbi:Transcriptional regulator, IclR family [Euzebya pacifica]|uniref:Transcriptional regulator, IclR family n=1 Tax=Euzebya pacifica TaxID=1608957 RepID=A0A346XXF7_9ACTN|nr:Transcriptional regulator, IclR family [Euzebya pacifica]
MLRALGQRDEGATVAELSVATSLDRAVLYRLLETLCETGFAVRDEGSRRYHLGVALVELGARAGRGLEVSRLATPGMRTLMEACNEAVCLGVRDGDDLVVVDRIEPQGLFVRVSYGVGFRHPLLTGAHGRALAAHLVEEDRAALSGDDGVLEALDAVRIRGYAVSNGELETGTTGVAAPIRDRTGNAVASLGVVAPTPRVPDPDRLAPMVVEVTTEISRRLGWDG